MQALKAVIANAPEYRAIYRRARQSRHRVTSVYDISSRCNLYCEGCLFFNRDGNFQGSKEPSNLGYYRLLFATEKHRGVTYPLLAGAEPSLEPEILKVAAQYFSNGMVHTNGTRRIDPDLPFRLYVSIWGDRTLTEKWRGADCYRKTLRNAAADPRAVINYTINAQNIHSILPLVAECADLGLQVTFQVYSPTADYTDYMANGSSGAHRYIRGDASDDTLALGPEDDRRAEAAVCEAIERYPQAVLFTQALARWVFARPAMFPDAPRDGSAPPDCFAANDPRHQHTLLGGGKETTKSCGHAAINCRTCRLYTTIYPRFFQAKLSQSMTTQDAIDFLDAHEVFHRLYEGHLTDQPTKRDETPPIPVVPAHAQAGFAAASA